MRTVIAIDCNLMTFFSNHNLLAVTDKRTDKFKIAIDDTTQDGKSSFTVHEEAFFLKLHLLSLTILQITTVLNLKM